MFRILRSFPLLFDHGMVCLDTQFLFPVQFILIIDGHVNLLILHVIYRFSAQTICMHACTHKMHIDWSLISLMLDMKMLMNYVSTSLINMI